jgi:hypothetical protein
MAANDAGRPRLESKESDERSERAVLGMRFGTDAANEREQTSFSGMTDGKVIESHVKDNSSGPYFMGYPWTS